MAPDAPRPPFDHRAVSKPFQPLLQPLGVCLVDHRPNLDDEIAEKLHYD
jgi:hypothetical protein